jgi:hypothetical protein
MNNKFDNKELTDFYYKLMHDMADRYFKGYTFFLVINAALFGYTFSSQVEQSLKSKILIVGLIISTLFLFATIANCIWMFGMYRTLRKLLSKASKESEFEFQIHSDTTKGWWLLQTMAVGATGSVITIIGAYIFLLM